jgi:hypothetical protein
MEAVMFSKRQAEEDQGEFWIERSRVSKPKGQGFYNKLTEHLARWILRGRCGRCARQRIARRAGAGRPGIDPVVYLKMPRGKLLGATAPCRNPSQTTKTNRP